MYRNCKLCTSFFLLKLCRFCHHCERSSRPGYSAEIKWVLDFVTVFKNTVICSVSVHFGHFFAISHSKASFPIFLNPALALTLRLNRHRFDYSNLIILIQIPKKLLDRQFECFPSVLTASVNVVPCANSFL